MAEAGALARWPLSAEVVAAAPGAGSCFGQTLAQAQETEHFVVERDDGVAPEVAADVAVWLEEALAAQVALGWPSPAGHERWKVAVLLYDRDLGGAATSARRCEGESLAVVVVGRDVFVDPVAAADTLAHEVNHVLQLALSDAPEVWYAEATATWMEEYARDTDGWARWIPGFSRATNISLLDDRRADPAVFLHMYGRSVWPFFLDEHVGGPEIVLQTWQAAATIGGARYSLGQDELLAAVGEDFASRYAEWLDVVAAMSFRDHDLFEPVTPAAELAVPGEASTDRMLAPWGQDFVVLTGDLSRGAAVRVEVQEGARWLVRAVQVRGAEVLVSLSLAEGEAALTLQPPAEGASWWIALSPVDAAPGAWTWRLEAAPLPETPDAPPCGCAGGGVGGAWAAVIAWAARRRRPSTVAASGAN
jgi:hypothetical protein